MVNLRGKTAAHHKNGRYLNYWCFLGLEKFHGWKLVFLKDLDRKRGYVIGANHRNLLFFGGNLRNVVPIMGMSLSTCIRIKIGLGLWLLLGACGSLLGAESSSVSLGSGESSNLKSSQTTIEFSHSFYVSSQEEFFKSRGTSPANTAIGFSLNDKMTVKRPCGSAIKGSVFYSLDEDQTYLNLSWVYLGCPLRNGYSLELGRVPHLWSRADQFWQQGAIEPRLLWEKNKPQSQGLTGVFLHKEFHSKFSGTLFASPMFVPDIGPGFKESNGRLVSSNPWFRPPTQSVNLFRKNHDVQVHVNAPEAKDVINNFSLGGQFKVQSKVLSKDVLVNVGALYKPINQFILSFPAHFDLNQTLIEAQVYPEVRYHRVEWLELSREVWGGDKAWISMSQDSPDNIPDRDGWILQTLNPSTTFGFYYGRDVIGQGYQATHLYLGYYKLWGGLGKDRGELASESSYFENRYFLSEAVRLGVKQPVFGRWFGRDWTSQAELTYDLKQRGVIFTSQLNMAWNQYTQVGLMADFIGLVEDVENTSGFIADYRANDSVQLRFSYVY